MPKFSEVLLGTRARKRIVLPLPGASVDPATGSWIGPTIPLDIRSLREDEDTKVLSEALAFAKARGLEDPGEGDPLYERGKALHTLVLACLDADSPSDDPRPFFDGGVDQIAKSEALSPEVVEYLYHQQQLFQDETNPLLKTLSATEFLAAAIKTAGGDQSFFVNSRPGMRWSFFRTTASQLVALRSSSSTSSTSSEAKTSE